MWCLDCDYELINLAETRCPECGRAFDANDPSTFKTEATVAQSRSHGITTMAVIISAALGIAASSLLEIESAFLRATLGAVAGTVSGVLAIVILGFIWRERTAGSEV